MNPDEIRRMAELEQQHWWYCGLRDALAKTLDRRRFTLPQHPSIVDAGCGTGANLQFLQDRYRPGYLGGFDLSPFSVEMSKRRVPDADVYQCSICTPEIHADRLDLIVSCDVVSIAGLADCRDGLNQLIAHLAPGGLFVLNLPAYKWLYSEHDVAIQTRERFTAARVRRLFDELGLRTALLTYRLCALLPVVVLTRLPTVLGRRPDPAQAKSDVHMPGRWMNSALRTVLQVENSVIRLGVCLPFGSSVFAIGQKASN